MKKRIGRNKRQRNSVKLEKLLFNDVSVVWNNGGVNGKLERRDSISTEIPGYYVGNYHLSLKCVRAVDFTSGQITYNPSYSGDRK